MPTLPFVLSRLVKWLIWFLVLFSSVCGDIYYYNNFLPLKMYAGLLACQVFAPVQRQRHAMNFTFVSFCFNFVCVCIGANRPMYTLTGVEWLLLVYALCKTRLELVALYVKWLRWIDFYRNVYYCWFKGWKCLLVWRLVYRLITIPCDLLYIRC